MVGGAASTLNQQYGLPSWVGGVVLTALAILTVVGDLTHWLTRSVWVGPAIVVLCIGIGVVTLFRDAGNVGAGLEVIRTGAFAEAGSETIKNAGPNWVISALSHAGSVLLWFASLRRRFGANNKRKDVEYGIYGGTIAVCVPLSLSCWHRLPILIQQVWEIQASSYGMQTSPILILAERIWKPLHPSLQSWYLQVFIQQQCRFCIIHAAGSQRGNQPV